MQLEMERQALKKERDTASKERLSKLEKELADLKEQSSRLKAQWQKEKEEITKSQRSANKSISSEPNSSRRRGEETSNALRKSNRKIPELQKQLDDLKTRRRPAATSLKRKSPKRTSPKSSRAGLAPFPACRRANAKSSSKWKKG